MNDNPRPGAASLDALVDALVAAAEASDIERMDELLDLLRLRADYEALVEDLMSSVDASDHGRTDDLLERLRALPTIEQFATMRLITN
ncbi:MAG TPA: hypothetical protein VEA80_01040 [Vitreimonas sp.]|uniref:hypothetical protein n=1 Tax=Vitreimonas sp. TaxID=3069702 RepID=UPI002D27178C|nr:hypothetical protein [Vitreimonas sp.]HYD86037.1 hypothetical protein [Vitreimonas sp.]